MSFLITNKEELNLIVSFDMVCKFSFLTVTKYILLNKFTLSKSKCVILKNILNILKRCAWWM